MSKIDQKYIDALETFTESLEKIVETLKEQQKSGVSDVVNDFLKSPMDNLVTVVEDLKNVTQNGFKEVKNDNKEILKKIESIKKQKESGMFDKIEDPKNKNKIVDGIKVVILIAAGVLALGLAFKIVGKVDFLSVIALSAAMYAMSMTFSKISGIKGLKISDILKIAGFMPIMAIGIALSGLILKKMSVISFQQGLSILFIGSTLGVASYFILKSMHNISPKSILLAPFIPFLLPLVALGIVKSSEILPGVKSITLKTVFDVALVGIAMGVATFVIGLSLKHLKKVDMKEMLLIPFILPLVATGLALSSNILKDFDPIKDPLKLLIGSAVIGISLLFFAPAILLLSKMSMKEILMGSLAAIAISGVILATAWIFTLLPDNMKYPSLMWSLGTGLSLLSFGVSAVLLGVGIMALGGISGALVLAAGLASILAVAGTIVLTSYILQAGKYDGNYPSLQWSLGVGAGLLGFSLAMIAASGAGIASAVGSLFTGGEDPLARVARSIVDISYFIQRGKYTGNYPSEKWSLGVGAALLGFSLAMVAAAAGGIASAIGKLFTNGEDPLERVARSIVDISHVIQLGKYTGNYPSVSWAVGVGALLLEFVGLTVAATTGGFVSAVGKLFTGDKDPLLTLTKSITAISREFLTGQYILYPDKKWTNDVRYALTVFANIATSLPSGNFFDRITGNNPLLALALSMTAISKVMMLGKWNAPVPDEKYTKSLIVYVKELLAVVDTWDIDVDDATNFNQGITQISSGLKSMSDIKTIPFNLSTGYALFFNSLNNMPKLTSSDSKITAVKKLTDNFAEMAETLGKVNINLQKFVDNYNRLDIKKLDQLSISVDKSASALGVKKPDEGGVLSNIASSISNLLGDRKEKKEIIQKQAESINKKQEMFYDDISEIRRLLSEMKDDVNKPTKSGSFHK